MRRLLVVVVIVSSTISVFIGGEEGGGVFICIGFGSCLITARGFQSSMSSIITDITLSPSTSALTAQTIVAQELNNLVCEAAVRDQCFHTNQCKDLLWLRGKHESLLTSSVEVINASYTNYIVMNMKRFDQRYVRSKHLSAHNTSELWLCELIIIHLLFFPSFS